MSDKSDFDLAEIEAFVTVARTASFRKAAAEAGTSQSSISERIGRLETKLRHPLFTRTTRSVELTQAGRSLLVYATAMLGLAEQVRGHFDQPPREGVLKLGIVEDYLVGDLPRILTLFKRQHPRFGLSLRTGLSTRLLEGLEEGTLDVVLAKRRPGRSRGRLLFTEPLIWVGRPDVLEGPGDSVPLATYPAPSETRDTMLDALRREGRMWTIAAESATLSGLAAAVASGFAISAFSRRFVPPSIPIVAPDLGLPALGSLDYVIDQRAFPREPAIDAFVEILAATAASDMNADEARHRSADETEFDLGP